MAIFLLSAIVFLPALGALILAFLPKDKPEPIRWFTLIVTAAVLVLALFSLLPGFETTGESSKWMQDTFNVDWIPSFSIHYYMGLDGISLPLVVLTAFISLLAMAASWNITKHVKGYCILFLLLETGMLGVFMSLDFFLFYVFWEVMLLPMYFLIGVWGGPRREYAAIKFFLYTLVGSVLMLIAILILYFNSDLKQVVRVSDRFGGPVQWEKLHISAGEAKKVGIIKTDCGEAEFSLWRRGSEASKLTVNFRKGDEDEAVTARYDAATSTVNVFIREKDATAEQLRDAIAADPAVASALMVVVPEHQLKKSVVLAKTSSFPDGQFAVEIQPSEGPVHSFNLLALTAMGQHCGDSCFSRSTQVWCFLLLFIGFVIKVPSVPVHTWLPDAHVEAPTPISMILAGVLLKMGGYGIIRICYPICPWGGYDLMFLVCLIGVVSMVYGAFAAMAQKDLKRLVAYSSVSHMGYVVLGLGVWSAVAGTGYNSDYWNMGVQGAMFQMIAHGISSAGMFFLVGVVYDRVHHRNINEFGGLMGKMPVYTGLSIGIFFAALGLPGLCGFIGEVFVVLSVWRFDYALAVISAAVVILTAGYILWTIQRVYLGAEYKGPHEESLKPITPREFSIAAPLFVFAILLGVFPYQTVLKYMDNTIDRQVEELTDWTRDVAEPTKAQAEKQQQDGQPQAVKSPRVPGRNVDQKDPKEQVVSAPATEDVSRNRLTSGVP